jgi:hypothetical protein
MNDQLQSFEITDVEQATPPQYQFVVDSDLVHVGGGSVVVNY